MYVGRTFNHSRRKREHFKKLSQGAHCNRFLQNSYNKYGAENFVFNVIEETTSDLVKEKELFWFKYLSGGGITLFNHVITESGGGTDSKTHITRSYIFDVIDKIHERHLGIKQGAKVFKTSSATVLKYIPEWEMRTGNKFCRQPQVAETLKRMTLFVEAWKIEGDSATRRLMDFKLSHQSLVKHLPKFGMSFDNVRLDDAFRTANQRAEKAKGLVERGLNIKSACKECCISISTFYKYRNQQAIAIA